MRDADVAGGAAVDPLTGWPTGGTTYVQLKAFNGQKYNAGRYNFSHSGTGSLVSVSYLDGTGPKTQQFVDIDGTTETIELRFSGAIVEPKLMRTGDADDWEPTLQAQHSNFNLLRFLNPLRVNNNPYNNNAPHVYNTKPASIDFYHTLLTMTEIRDYCEKAGCDAWINIHHLANATNLSAFVSVWQNFTGALWVEHSNEIWNPQFAVHSYAKDTAQIAPYDPGRPDLSAHAWHWDRTDEIAQQFKAARTAATYGVYGTQHANTFWIKNVTSLATRAGDSIDSIAIAPYFGRSTIGPPSGITLAALQAMSGSDMARLMYQDWFDRAKALVQEHKDEADGLGKGCVCYECGPSNINGNSAIEDELMRAIRDDEMGVIWGEYLDEIAEIIEGPLPTEGQINTYRLKGDDEFGVDQYGLVNSNNGTAVIAKAVEYNS